MSHRNQCLSYTPKRLVQRFDLSLAIVVMKSTYKCFYPRSTGLNIAAEGGRKGAYDRDIRTCGSPNEWLCVLTHSQQIDRMISNMTNFLHFTTYLFH